MLTQLRMFSTLFIFNFWLCWVLFFLCDFLVVASGGFSCCGAPSLSPELSCSVPRGILPDQGSSPCPLSLAGEFLTADHQRNHLIPYFKHLFFKMSHLTPKLASDITSPPILGKDSCIQWCKLTFMPNLPSNVSPQETCKLRGDQSPFLTFSFIYLRHPRGTNKLNHLLTLQACDYAMYLSEQTPQKKTEEADDPEAQGPANGREGRGQLVVQISWCCLSCTAVSPDSAARRTGRWSKQRC